MKRYEHCNVLNRMISADDGEWVKAEIAVGMYYLLESLKDFVSDENEKIIEKTLQKARGE